ncbi:MAG TPA: hypothetical protein VFA79_19335 [Myxococcales bacterium]|nr:hypothetical protein [Myxococcales bacterium]
MADADLILIQRAAGAVLRGLKRKSEPLRPAAAIEALLSAMRARFELSETAARDLLGPALADWRDAVGCADPLLVAANAQGLGAETQLVPIPMPSWCATLVDAGVLRLDGPPAIEGPRVVQHATLLAIRESELTAVECFPLVFAGRYGSGAASLQIHLALSPPFLAEGWRGTLCLRAGVQRLEKARAPVRFWLGPPASPGAAADSRSGATVVTWAMPRAQSRALAGWPSGWPRWAVLRILEGREPQALWELPALWRACTASSPGAGVVDALSPTPGALRLAVDLGSTSTLVVEEDSAAAGSIGAKLLPQGTRRPAPSGLRRLAGDPASAHRVGCAEHLLAPSGQIPTALAAPAPEAIAALLDGSPGATEQLWLPQGPPSDDGGPPFLVDRFKSPELLLLSEWLAQIPAAAEHRAEVSGKLLEAFAWHLGRTLAAAHAAPLVTSEGGRWTQRAPRLGSVEAVLTYPDCGFDAGAGRSFRAVFEDAARELCRGLCGAWAEASHRLVADPRAARAGRSRAQDERHPIEAFVDFGGLTLQITVRVPAAHGRPAPQIAGSSISYLLGGERLIDAAAFAHADRATPAALRDAYRATARGWRSLIATGGALRDPEAARHPAVGAALLGLVLGLVQRQVEGTLRRAAPDLSTLRGAGLRLHLLGEGWKLAALDVADELREAEMLRRVEATLGRRPLHAASLQLERMTKRRVCEGALRVRSGDEAQEAALELQGVDVASPEGLRQRWFGIADPASAPEPDLGPHSDDPWWQEFASGAPSLLRVEQWFSGPFPAFETGLSGGNLSFDGRRSILKQWVDVSGPSLVALRIRQALQP